MILALPQKRSIQIGATIVPVARAAAVVDANTLARTGSRATFPDLAAAIALIPIVTTLGIPRRDLEEAPAFFRRGGQRDRCQGEENDETKAGDSHTRVLLGFEGGKSASIN
jgi:hypothetical protein